MSPFWLFGFALPLAAVIGGWVLPCLLLILYLGIQRDLAASPGAQKPHSGFRIPDWFIKWVPLFAYLTGWAVVGLFRMRGLAIADDAERSFLQQIFEVLSLPVGLLPALREIMRWGAVLLLLRLFSLKSGKFRTELLSGLVTGALVGGVLAMLQGLYYLFSGEGLFWHEQDWFWTKQGRFSATFSDPNAFGVGVLLLLPLLWEGRKVAAKRAFLAAFLLLCAVPFSGSRSFIIGAVLLAFIMLLLTRRRSLAVPIFVAIISLSLIVVAVKAELFPLPMQRMFGALHIEKLGTTLESRFIFNRIGAEIFKLAPLFGVGPHAFSNQVVSVSSRLGLDTGLWQDNSNNFYLGLFSELGIIGVVFFLLGLSGLRWRKDAPLFLRAAVLTFACLLIVGPHTDFWEILFLFLIVASGVVEFQTSSYTEKSRRIFLGITGIAFAAGICGALPRGYGFYGWEKGKELPYRWTGATASEYVWCDPADPLTLRFRTLEPGVSREAVQVQIDYQGVQELERRDSSPIDLPLHCAVAEWQRYRVAVSRVWDAPGQADARLLGVQVFGIPPARVHS